MKIFMLALATAVMALVANASVSRADTACSGTSKRDREWQRCGAKRCFLHPFRCDRNWRGSSLAERQSYC